MPEQLARLTEFKFTEIDGMAVDGVKLTLTGIGDGLSRSLSVDPAEHHSGDRIFLVVEATMNGLGFEPADKDEPGGTQIRVEKYHAESAAFVDRDLVRSSLEEQAARIQKARDEASGQLTLDQAAPPEKPKSTTDAVPPLGPQVADALARKRADAAKNRGKTGDPAKVGDVLDGAMPKKSTAKKAAPATKKTTKKA